MKWRTPILILASAIGWTAAAVALHASSPAQTTDCSYRVLLKLSDGWEVSSLDAEGIDSEKIETLTRQMITEQRFVNVRSMLIVSNGKLVREAYSPYCQRNTLHSLASITKAVSSTLIGIGIDKGFIEAVAAKVVDLLPEFAAAVEDPQFQQITLEHLITMSSGLEWRSIRDLIKRHRTEDIMLLRFDDTEITGLFSTDGYIDL